MTTTLDTTDPDAALVREARGGNETAFSELVTRYERSVYQLSLRLCGNSGDAEDVLQDTFLLVFRKLGSFRGTATFRTWLYRIATNAALMHRRRHARRRNESLDQYLPEFRRDGRHKRIDVDYSAAARIERVVHKRQLSRLVLDALQRLPDSYRSAIVLCDLQEMHSHAVAEILRVTPQTVRQRVHRGRLLLRGYLDSVAERETAMIRAMTCRQTIQRLMDYVEGRLDARSRRALESHLDECPRCQEFLTSYRSIPLVAKRATARTLPSRVARRLRPRLAGGMTPFIRR